MAAGHWEASHIPQWENKQPSICEMQFSNMYAHKHFTVRILITCCLQGKIPHYIGRWTWEGQINVVDAREERKQSSFHTIVGNQ